MNLILRADITRDRRAPSAAREAIDSLAGTVDPSMIPDARLLVSELITNSVKYGNGGPVTLEVTADDHDAMRVEVIDQGSGFVPTVRNKPKTEVGGWGLHLVEELSDRWGVHEGSTHVWFELNA
jgi:anti-sigma regulatory factor (Ser/Thr protein kinase)